MQGSTVCENHLLEFFNTTRRQTFLDIDNLEHASLWADAATTGLKAMLDDKWLDERYFRINRHPDVIAAKARNGGLQSLAFLDSRIVKSGSQEDERKADLMGKQAAKDISRIYGRCMCFDAQVLILTDFFTSAPTDKYSKEGVYKKLGRALQSIYRHMSRSKYLPAP